ncbi:patatin-like phospholipase family protein [Dyadobacter sp. CY107]|uniref:patatin-like phospholipase family protein n=1 Tax=Dyadobacter fanqingshengii TaxID=2906443 RepID=UPI001F3E2030|nr:patatin-like phospholipase family protein [Dyadobacter fanqingshengii]MCF2502714.1 patatin-like phospholipase family protein [Dyadobacter fanqingshengii]
MKNIALSLSGGGFRAAAFSLGALSYLDHLKLSDGTLLERVKFIGSTSGGSITNLVYATGKCGHASFDAIYGRLLEAIEGELVIDKALEKLKNDSVWKEYPDKSRNLINAFSLAYNEQLFANQHFDYLNSKLPETHIEQVCVNATELANGLSFRFQSQHPDPGFGGGRIGNQYVNFKASASEVSGKVRLADVLASSSCFPGGFEPLLFPEDFSHPQLSIAELNSAINFRNNPFSTSENPEDLFKDEVFKNNPKRFALLDGGIADNQAIDSVLLANQRRINHQRESFDMILICDVTSFLMDGFTLPMPSKSFFTGFSILFLHRTLLLLAALFPLTLAGLFVYGWVPNLSLLLIPLAVAFGTYLFIRSANRKARENAHSTKSTWGIIFFRYVKYFLKLRLGLIGQMLGARLKSVFLITSDIFLKQIRAHYYEKLFGDEQLRNIVVANAIYDLSKVKQKAWNSIRGVDEQADIAADKVARTNEAIPKPSESLINVAEKARLVATTLWFDEHSRGNNEKASVVATGQFTLCFNLIKHLIRIKELDAQSVTGAAMPIITLPIFDEEKAALLDALLTDWALFNKYPFWLYSQKEKTSH